MIPDRDKVVVLVVEMKEKDIKYWYKIDAEVRKILDESGLTEPRLTERGVCVRYYEFWDGWKEEEHGEREEAARIRVRERAAQHDLESSADLEERAETFGSHIGQLVRTETRRRAAIPRTAGLRAPRRASLAQEELRQQLGARVEE
jgi:hypothetical protein